MQQLKSKKIIITGGAQGIGESVARAYAAAGAALAVLDLNDDAGAQLVARVKDAFPAAHTHYYHCESADRQQVARVFRSASSGMGGLDVLANIAGVHQHCAPDAIDPDLYRFISYGNVLGAMNTNCEAY